jgi:hypothetical protein
MASTSTARHKTYPRGRAATAAALAALTMLTTASCGSSMNASTTCADFLQADQQSRDALVSKLAVDLNRPKVLQFAYRGNVEFNCSESIHKPIGDVIKNSAPAS